MTNRDATENEVGQADTGSAQVAVKQPAQADIFGLIELVLQNFKLVAAIVGLGAVSSVAYALLAEEWYTSRIVLSPANQQDVSRLAEQFGGLSSLIGLDMGESNDQEAKAILVSRDLARQFILDNSLVQEFFSDEWDAENQEWLADDPEDWPDERDAVDYFEDHVRNINEDASTGLITLYISWKDPEIAAGWANELVARVNSEMRRRAMSDARANIEYLQEELAATNQVALQQSIGGVLESELSQLLMARGNEQFAFKIVDSAEAPKYRSSPQRALIVMSTTLFAFVFAVIIVLIRAAYRRRYSA